MDLYFCREGMKGVSVEEEEGSVTSFTSYDAS